MATYRITAPDGGTYEVTAPDNANESDVLAYAQQNYSKGAAKKSDTSLNVAGGILRGAGSIGATLLAPVDAAARALGIQNDYIGRTDRREAMDAALESKGVDTGSLPFKGSKLGTEVAGTLGVGGLAGNALKAALPAAAATKLAPFINALQSGGMSTGAAANPSAGLGLWQRIASAAPDLAVRTVGGAANGGLSAGLVNPEDAGTGAAIGGLLPGALGAAGKIGSAIGSGVKTVATNALGMTTGVGPEPIRQAFQAGKTGNQAFVDNMTGAADMTDVLAKAKAGIQTMAAKKSAEYSAGMVPVKGDKTVLSFTGIDQAVSDAANMGAFKGQVKNEAAASAIDKMRAAVNEWKALDPAQYHTAEGLDALKQRLGGILESIPFEQKTARAAAQKVYNATKSEIENQAPGYAKVMKDYTQASELITEIERALSLGKKAAADTSMRKLQSLMRNNVNTNYGNRLNLAQELEQQGGVSLMPDIAGQALSSWTPRGLASVGSGVTGVAALSNPAALALLPMQSPRLVGNLAYGAGRATGGAQNALSAASPALTNNALLQSLGVTDPALIPGLAYRAAPTIGASR